MGFLSKEQILNVDDLRHEDVEVPQWGGTVRVRSLTAKERDEFEHDTYIQNGPDTELNYQNMRARLVVKCLVDDQGNRLFEDKETESLGKKHGAVIDMLFWKARKLSAFTEADMDVLIKNSRPVPSANDSGESA
jgi:hypothetical protein